MEFGDADPAADFLAREQDQLAGIGDDIIPAATTTQPAADADLFGPVEGDAGFGGLEDQPPADLGFELDAGAAPLDAGPAGDAQDLAPVAPVPAAPSPVPREEPEKIRRWREEQRQRLEEKDADEERRKQEMREAAAKELADWYKQHEETVSKTRAANREAEKELVSGDNKSTETAADWEQIAKLCEFNPKVSRNTKDTSRMRSLILQLKQSPPVKAN